MQSQTLKEPNDVLFRIKRGLAGYISYLAACEMNESFSEYVLYEPILRILTARHYEVKCEYVCPGVEQPARGDKKKIDFVATLDNFTFALEVKWARKRRPDISADLDKLIGCRNTQDWRAFFCVFGKESVISNIILDPRLKEIGKIVMADFKKTKYGCRVYELILQNANLDSNNAEPKPILVK